MITVLRSLKSYLIPIVTVSLALMIGLVALFNTKTVRHNGPAVIFDMDGVLFKTNRSGAFGKLGKADIISYALRGNSPSELHTKAFDILFKMRGEKAEDFEGKFWPTYEGKPLPTIMCQWQQGTVTPQAILDEVLPYVEKLDKEGYFVSAREKRIMQNLFDIMFNPQTRIEITQPLAEGVRILNHVKKAGYRVYVLSNMDTESMKLLQEKYPEILGQFDGIVYSADIKQIKPYNQIYYHLLQKYNLVADQCLFLDNQQENIEAAKNLGINTMLCTKKSMKSLGNKLHRNMNIDPRELVAQCA